MKVPLEIAFRGVEKTDALEDLIREKAAKLDQVCDNLISCRVIVEKPQQNQQTGSPYRVVIDMRVPPGHELVVQHKAVEGSIRDSLPKIIRNTFDSARRQLKELMERERNKVKIHPEQQLMAVVVRLFREQGYGFIRGIDGQEFYFHRNSVLHDDFDRLEIGTGVRFIGESGVQGPQASTVEIVDKPGARVSEFDHTRSDIPLGWKE